MRSEPTRQVLAGLADRLGDAYLLVPEAVLVDTEVRTGYATVVRHGRFTDVGAAEELRYQHRDLVPVEAPGQLLMPGFVDAHHHLSQAFGTALAFGEPSEVFRRVWVPLESALTEDELYASAKLAALESLRGGFTTVADAGTRSPHGPEPIAQATADVGLRVVLPRVVADADCPQDSRLQLAAAERHLLSVEHQPLTHGSLAVPVPEAAQDATLRAVTALCHEHGVPLQIHVNEHLVGVERALVARGRRPLQLLDDLGVVSPRLLAAHTTLLTPEEMLMLRDRGAAVSYNPTATAWKGNAVAPASMLAALGVRMGLGTDGTRSDAFRLLDAAETVQRLSGAMQAGDPYAGSGRRWLAAATDVSADAVGLGSLVGRIAPDYAADFLLVDLDVPELVSTRDLVWELVRRGNRDQIGAVVVDGRVRLVDGEPVDWDARAFLAEARKAARSAVQRAGLGGDAS